jgi:hypothetical protein
MRMRWVGHMTHLRSMRNAYKIVVGRLGVERTIILKLFLRECGAVVWCGLV